jgi:hypothetical protein
MKYTILTFLIIILGCSTTKNTNGKILNQYQGNAQLVPIAANDTSYTNYFNVKPGVTPNGWQIRYMVKNDTTCYTDAYIQWEKDDLKRVVKCSNVLTYRGAFMPQFLDETKTHIFMDHWCATDCMAVLVLPKNATDEAIDFEAILAYNFDLGRLVCTDYSDDNKLIVHATDLNRKKTKSVTFKNPYYSLGNAPVDTIIFKGNRIIIDCDFFDKDGETIKEEHVIKF